MKSPIFCWVSTSLHIQIEAFSLKVDFVYNLLVLSVIVGKFVQFIMLCICQVITSLLDFHPQVKETAENVDDALRELPDANTVKSPDYLYPMKSFCIQFFS